MSKIATGIFDIRIATDNGVKIQDRYIPQLVKSIREGAKREMDNCNTVFPTSMIVKINHPIEQTPHKDDTIKGLLYNAKTLNEIVYITIPYFKKVYGL